MIILPIKKKWFDMILSGIKKEEYRDIKPYYTKRFMSEGLFYNRSAVILFRNGYSNKSPYFKALCSLYIKEGKEEWGAIPGQKYYVLEILKVYKKKGGEK